MLRVLVAALFGTSVLVALAGIRDIVLARERRRIAQRLEARVDRRTQELEALYDVSREISSRLDLDQVLNSVAEKARGLLRAETAYLCLLDTADQALRLQSRELLGADIAVSASRPLSETWSQARRIGPLCHLRNNARIRARSSSKAKGFVR